MPAEPEVLSDGTRSGKESLGVSGGLEPLHASLALPGRLVRVLCTVIEVAVLTMFHPGEDLPFRGRVFKLPEASREFLSVC
jgi:hypothetical protein